MVRRVLAPRVIGALSLVGSAALVFTCSSIACGNLKSADDASDGAVSTDADGAVSDEGSIGNDAALGDAAMLGDGATPDAGAPPVDFECTDPWTTVTKSKPECAPRQVKVVDATSPIDPSGVSIARTSTGRVGIVYNAEQGAETGELHLLHFTPATATFAAPQLVVQATGFAFHNGYRTAIAASAPDTLAVLAFDMDDDAQSGTINLHRLVAGASPLVDDLVATGVKNPTEIAVGSDSAGNVTVTYRVSTGPTTAKLSASRKTPTGAFAALPDLTTKLLPEQAPATGGGSFFVESSGQVHLLFHYNEVMAHSTPHYHTLAGTTWSAAKTVDNAALDGLSGFSSRIAVLGNKKYAVYFFRKAGQTVPVTADLRLATWSAPLDVPVIEILDQQIPSPDPQYPTYRVAMAVDKYGLVHIAQIRPDSATSGYLEYRRQTPVAGGGTKWLSDIVDDDVVADGSQAYVDMVVDDEARPHIAYISAKDGRVKYATRFDR